MSTFHPDAPAIERLGRDRIQAHFGISRQAMDYWKIHGVPHPHRKTLAMLGAMNGIPMPEMEAPRKEPTP